MLTNIVRPGSNNVHASHRFYVPSYVDRRLGQGGQMYNNAYAYTFRLRGFLLGCLIIFFAAALLSTELGRVYSGSITRGRNDSNGSFQYLTHPNVIVGFNGDLRNPKPENGWIWPWSTATLLFGLIIFTTGALGIMSGVRQSYSTILTFFIGLLLSICLLVFLIATYATIIAGWKEIYGTDRNAMPSFVQIDKDFASGCLAISCALFIILLVSLILSGKTIDVCSPKEYPRPHRAYERLQGIGTPQLNPRTPQTPRAPRLKEFNGLI